MLMHEVSGPSLEKHRLSASWNNPKEGQCRPWQCHPPGSPAARSPGSALSLGPSPRTTKGVANQGQCVCVRGCGFAGGVLFGAPTP